MSICRDRYGLRYKNFLFCSGLWMTWFSFHFSSHFVDSQARAFSAYLSVSQTACSLLAQEKQMPPSASLIFTLRLVYQIGGNLSTVSAQAPRRSKPSQARVPEDRTRSSPPPPCYFALPVQSIRFSDADACCSGKP